MTRGILYITFPGDKPTSQMLARSIASVAKVHPELPHHVATMESGTLLDKSKMFDLSPYDETLFLDADTVVLDRLDYGFDKAAKHGIAISICECPWARRYRDFTGDDIEYNTGVIFFTRSAKPVFDSWQELAWKIDSSILFHGDNGLSRMPFNDQASFALAIEHLGFNPWILPLNWNFRPLWHRTAFGQVKIWHDYDPVPSGLLNWNDTQTKTEAIVSCMRLA